MSTVLGTTGMPCWTAHFRDTWAILIQKAASLVDRTDLSACFAILFADSGHEGTIDQLPVQTPLRYVKKKNKKKNVERRGAAGAAQRTEGHVGNPDLSQGLWQLSNLKAKPGDRNPDNLSRCHQKEACQCGIRPVENE